MADINVDVMHVARFWILRKISIVQKKCGWMRLKDRKIYDPWICHSCLEHYKHGKWNVLDNCSNAGVYCSECGKKVYRSDYANQKVKSNFCQHCGAKMDVN